VSCPSSASPSPRPPSATSSLQPARRRHRSATGGRGAASYARTASRSSPATSSPSTRLAPPPLRARLPLHRQPPARVRRRTSTPNTAWMLQQARNLLIELDDRQRQTRFLIHDRDAKFPRAFDALLASEKIKVIRTPVRAPNANAHMARWVGSVPGAGPATGPARATQRTPLVPGPATGRGLCSHVRLRRPRHRFTQSGRGGSASADARCSAQSSSRPTSAAKA
jgi:hypothetical protein